MRQICISWIYQRRPDSMREPFGFELVQLAYAFRSRWKRPIEYVLKAAHSFAILVARCPDVIWVAAPPTVLIYVPFAYALFRRRRPRIIVDAHNGTFGRPWVRLPFIRRMLWSADVVVVHNEMMREPAVNCGVPKDRIFVLEDRPASIRGAQPEAAPPRPLIVFPCSFDLDEPVAAFLDAAARLPEFDFVVTGRLDRARGRHDLSKAPENAKLSGYLPKREFERLLASATAVCGLTNLEGCQLCVASEAVGVGTPLVLSGTRILRQLFPKGVVYAETNDPESIATACRTAVWSQRRLRKEIRELRSERLARWRDQAAPLAEWIGSAKKAPVGATPEPQESWHTDRDEPSWGQVT